MPPAPEVGGGPLSGRRSVSCSSSRLSDELSRRVHLQPSIVVDLRGNQSLADAHPRTVVGAAHTTERPLDHLFGNLLVESRLSGRFRLAQPLLVGRPLRQHHKVGREAADQRITFFLNCSSSSCLLSPPPPLHFLFVPFGKEAQRADRPTILALHLGDHLGGAGTLQGLAAEVVRLLHGDGQLADGLQAKQCQQAPPGDVFRREEAPEEVFDGAGVEVCLAGGVVRIEGGGRVEAVPLLRRVVARVVVPLVLVVIHIGEVRVVVEVVVVLKVLVGNAVAAGVQAHISPIHFRRHRRRLVFPQILLFWFRIDDFNWPVERCIGSVRSVNLIWSFIGFVLIAVHLTSSIIIISSVHLLAWVLQQLVGKVGKVLFVKLENGQVLLSFPGGPLLRPPNPPHQQPPALRLLLLLLLLISTTPSSSGCIHPIQQKPRRAAAPTTDVQVGQLAAPVDQLEAEHRSRLLLLLLLLLCFLFFAASGAPAPHQSAQVAFLEEQLRIGRPVHRSPPPRSGGVFQRVGGHPPLQAAVEALVDDETVVRPTGVPAEGVLSGRQLGSN
ncbi:hypothetical protein TYRP_009717 [Tyrophagus putrescentiae]|nr:hypothetical protein TYRP_009717 [Tyrophagus putrescentiae]